jgi:hypothetical protein
MKASAATEPLVFDNRTLVDLTQLIENVIAEFDAAR